MSRFHNARTLHRTIGGIALLGAPSVGVIGSIVYMPFATGAASNTPVIAAQPTRFLVANLLFLLTEVLLLPAILALLHLLRDRSTILGHLGASFGLLGVLGHTAFIGYSAAQVPLVQSLTDPAQLQTVGQRAMTSPFFAITLLTFLLGTYLGFILLAVGLWRSRIAAPWTALLLALPVVTDMAAPPHISLILTNLLLLLSLGWLGLRVLRMNDAEWDQPMALPGRLQPVAG